MTVANRPPESAGLEGMFLGPELMPELPDRAEHGGHGPGRAQ